MDIIKSCGHYMPMVKDLQLAKTNWKGVNDNDWY
jgi:hypothetical protein